MFCYTTCSAFFYHMIGIVLDHTALSQRYLSLGRHNLFHKTSNVHFETKLLAVIKIWLQHFTSAFTAIIKKKKNPSVFLRNWITVQPLKMVSSDVHGESFFINIL